MEEVFALGLKRRKERKGEMSEGGWFRSRGSLRTSRYYRNASMWRNLSSEFVVSLVFFFSLPPSLPPPSFFINIVVSNKCCAKGRREERRGKYVVTRASVWKMLEPEGREKVGCDCEDGDEWREWQGYHGVESMLNFRLTIILCILYPY